MKLYMFRTVRLSIIRSLFTVHSAIVYVIQVYRQLSSRTRMELQFQDGTTVQGWNYSSILVLLESCMTYTIAECTVNKLLIMDRGNLRNMLSFMPE